MRRAILLTVTATVLAAALATAQVGSKPPASQTQTPATDPPKATALILGQVIDGTSGQPIADAIVTLIAPGGRGRGGNPLAAAGLGGLQGQQAAAAAALVGSLGGRGGGGGPARVMTGADGRFVFHGLVPGQYQVQVSLTGYTSSLASSAGGGALGGILAALGGSGGGGTTLQLKEGEFATALKLRLWKHAVITGSIVDDGGEPAVGVTVQVARRATMGGRARYVPGETAQTDDRGAFRINGLVPGNYVVVVPQTQVSIPTTVMSSLIDSVTGNGPGGGGYGAGCMGGSC